MKNQYDKDDVVFIETVVAAQIEREVNRRRFDHWEHQFVWGLSRAIISGGKPVTDLEYWTAQVAEAVQNVLNTKERHSGQKKSEPIPYQTFREDFAMRNMDTPNDLVRECENAHENWDNLDLPKTFDWEKAWTEYELFLSALVAKRDSLAKDRNLFGLNHAEECVKSFLTKVWTDCRQ